MFKFDDILMKLVTKDLSVGVIPMLLGEPGIGKSSWFKALAGLMHTRCFTVACNQLADKADLTGARLVPVVDQSGVTTGYKQVFYPHSDIYDCIEYAKANPRETPILFLDEINRTSADVTSAALSISTDRKIGSIELPKNVRIVTAGNDKGNITSLDSASVTRFSFYTVTPDVQTFLALDPDLNIFVKNVLTAHPECVFCKPIPAAASGKDDDGNDADLDLDAILADDRMEQFTTPRTISGLSRWLNTFDNQELLFLLSSSHIEDGAQVNDLQQAIESHVGATPFTQFLLQEISSGCSQNTNNQSNVLAVPKPAVYDQLKACPDITSMRDCIATMSDNDRSGCIVYALYEHQDNTVIIKNLAAFTNQLAPADLRTLMHLGSTGHLDSENVNVLQNEQCPLSATLSAFLAAM